MLFSGTIRGTTGGSMDKFVKLLALAGSDNDAEALAALRAASRLLKELKMDWNDMARMLSKTVDQINKKRDAEKRSEQRARFQGHPAGKDRHIPALCARAKEGPEVGRRDESLAVANKSRQGARRHGCGDQGKARPVGQTKGTALHWSRRGAEFDRV